MLSSRWSTRKEICLQTTEHFESLWKSCKNSQIKPISFNMLPPVLCHVHSGNVSSSNEPRRVTVNFMFLKLKNGNVPQIYTHSNPSGCMQYSHYTDKRWTWLWKNWLWKCSVSKWWFITYNVSMCQSLSTHPRGDGKSGEVSESTNHSWSFTAKRRRRLKKLSHVFFSFF